MEELHSALAAQGPWIEGLVETLFIVALAAMCYGVGRKFGGGDSESWWFWSAILAAICVPLVTLPMSMGTNHGLIPLLVAVWGCFFMSVFTGWERGWREPNYKRLQEAKQTLVNEQARFQHEYSTLKAAYDDVRPSLAAANTAKVVAEGTARKATQTADAAEQRLKEVIAEAERREAEILATVKEQGGYDPLA